MHCRILTRQRIEADGEWVHSHLDYLRDGRKKGKSICWQEYREGGRMVLGRYRVFLDSSSVIFLPVRGRCSDGFSDSRRTDRHSHARPAKTQPSVTLTSVTYDRVCCEIRKKTQIWGASEFWARECPIGVRFDATLTKAFETTAPIRTEKTTTKGLNRTMISTERCSKGDWHPRSSVKKPVQFPIAPVGIYFRVC
jgi:hypothetical protein